MTKYSFQLGDKLLQIFFGSLVRILDLPAYTFTTL